MSESRGFVTVATGSEKYYKLAYNLCLSYKQRGKGEYPFALICDKETEYSSIFDEVIIVQDKDVRKSTIDKLLMRYSPYEKSIFIETDILILDSIDDLWNTFENEDDVSAFGCKLPLDSQKGWFTYEGSGKYKSQIHYLISMNGGIYCFKKSKRASRVFDKAIELIDEYSTFDFKYFNQPTDEPLMAMSMVLNECAPCDVAYEMIILPACKDKVTTDYRGNVYEGQELSKAKIIHFSSPRTNLFLYNYLNSLNFNNKKSRLNYLFTKIKYMPKDLNFDLKHNAGAFLRKIGLSELVEKLK
ncbi:MAG: hypothetical protein J1E85_02875 [Ruminococcus sp.]|nr:hypothetical protein [Ruminococcus sp.]